MGYTALILQYSVAKAVADAGGDPGVQRNHPFKPEKKTILFYTSNNEIPA